MSVTVAESGTQRGGGLALTARRIAELVGGELVGDPEASVDHVAPLPRAGMLSVTFVGSAKYAAALGTSNASVVLVSPQFRDAPSACGARIVVERPQEALLELLPLLHPATTRVPGIDPSVRIGRGARIGTGVYLGPYVVIGAGAVIGDRSQLEAHVVVGDGVTVGTDVHLYPAVTLYAGTSLGDRVTVHAGARIGSDGFGYVFSRGAHQKIPHVGRCIIESDVEIGANSTVDRGSIDDTVVGAGTKLDNLVHLGHNVRIGKLCLLMAQVGIAGSTHIGDGVIVAGQAGVGGHLTIGSGARVGAQAGVMSSIPAGETWSGYPARPHRQALRTQAVLHKLTAMFSKIEKLLRDDG